MAAAIRTLTVPDQARGARLDAWLSQAVPDLSRSRLKALIESGAVTLGGERVKPSRLLRGGETVSLTVTEPAPTRLEPQSMPLAILFEDEDLVAVDKPAGLVVHPGHGNPQGTLVNALLAHCRDLPGIGGELRPGIVHRLDKETSGCIVVAKSERALRGLQAQFKGRAVLKRYLALVHGAPAGRGRLETLHARHPTDRLRFTGKLDRGRPAITEWVVAERFAGASLVQVDLVTGRTHQIRVHFAEAGHPLLADALYGGMRRERRLPADSPVRRAALALGRQALHAWRVELAHPVTGAPLRLEAPLPRDFQEALALLRAPCAPLSGEERC